MESFVVSARKYRPATFDTVVGQGSVTRTLQNAIASKQLAQAFLFSGPRGVGKTTCARILAKTINCFDLSAKIEACDKCESCLSFNSGASLNIFELDAASNNGVDKIRELVEQVRFAPVLGRYKVYIIDEVHMLTTQAFNAFLKTLEEPPSYAIFILATTEKHKILPTILSRCQSFTFNRIEINDIAGHLASIAEKESVKAENDALQLIALKADGALRDSLSMFDQLVTFSSGNLTYASVIENLNILDYEYYFRMTDALLAANSAQALIIFDEILAKGFEGDSFVGGLSNHFRDLLVSKDEITLKLLQTSDGVKQRYKAQTQSCSLPFIYKALDILNLCDINYRGAKNHRLHVELNLIRLCALMANGSAAPESEKKKPEPAVNISTAPAASVTPVAAAAAPVAQVQRTPTRTVPPIATTSISAALKGAANPAPAVVSTPVAAPDETPVEATVPTDGKLLESHKVAESWADYAKLMQQKGNVQLSAILSSGSPRVNGQDIEFELTNKVSYDQVQSEKADLMNFLREQLNSNAFQVKLLIKEQEIEAAKPYTDNEKLKYLIEKNPAIGKLRSDLDLGPVY